MREGEESIPRTQEEEGDDLAISPLNADPTARRGLSFVAFALRGAQRASQRRVAATAATALLVAAVVAGMFAHATSDPGGAVATLLRLSTATPIATFVPGANAIYFTNGAPWGTLTIDGKRLPNADLTGYGTSVTRGVHHLVYQARYFPTLRCEFSAPRASTDTCPLDTSDTTFQYLLSQGLARAINLGSTGATLRADQRAALTQLANDLLKRESATATIAPGDRYLDDQGQIVTATAPLQFQLALALDSSGAGATIHISGAEPDCYQFCPDPTFDNSPAPAGAGWPTRVTVTSALVITDASGHALTGAQYQAGQQLPNVYPVDVGVQLTPAGWKINGLEDLAIQSVQSAAMDSVYQAEGAGSTGGMGVSFTVGTNPLNGCVMDVDYGGARSRLLWRFGALVAVDQIAHHVFPQLPVANAAEQALVASILAQPPLRDDSILPKG